MTFLRWFSYRGLGYFLAYFPGLFFIGLALWTHRFFGDVSLDQALSTLAFGADGVLGADAVFLKRFIEWCCFWPSVLAFFLCCGQYWGQRRWQWRRHFILPLLLLMGGLGAVVYQYSAWSFFKTRQSVSQDYFLQSYVDPHQVTFRVHQPKSLVLIYVESLETTYTNKQLFDRDLLHSLTILRDKHISFTNYEPMPGTQWTMAGIVATQCALPLKQMTIFDRNRFTENVEHFLPRAQCLGDILAAHGYKNIFLGGASLSFAGKGKFLTEHHYTQMIGQEEWTLKGLLNINQNGWGLADDALLAQAKIELAKLIKSKQLFNLTILTVDTHGDTGHLNAACMRKGYQDFKGIVECTADSVADFARYVEQQGWLEKVNLVIIGDHLAMQNPVADKLNSIPERRIVNIILSKNHLVKKTETIVPFDLLPTVLDSLGFEYADGQLGLGLSGFRSYSEARVKDRIAYLRETVLYKSLTYNKLWSDKQRN